MTRLSYEFQQVRSRICNVFLLVAIAAAIPALAASLYRITATGWLPVMGIQAGLFVSLLLIVLLRNRLPLYIRAGFIVAALLVLGLGGLWQVGLVGSAVVFLVAAPAMSAIFFGARVGVIVLITTVLATGTIGTYIVRVQRLPPFDPAFYALQPTSWLTMIVAWSLVAATLLAALIMYNRDLTTALRDANRSEDELTQRIEERTEALRREVEERRAIESELRVAESALIEANSDLEERIDARTRELEAEKEKFRNIVENAPVKLSLKTLEGVFTIINPVARAQAEAAGVTIDEGQTAYDTWPSKLADMFREQDLAVVDAGSAQHFEVVLPTRDGDRVINTTKFPVRNEDGEISAIGTIGIDITREREAETKLRESEERFRSLFEHSPNAVSLKDIRGRYLLVNARFETLMGICRESVIGKTVEEVFDGAFALSGIECDRAVFARRRTVEIEELYQRGDRTLRFRTTKFPIFNDSGEVAAIAAVHTDLTKRIEAEEAVSRRETEYRLLVELIPDSVIVQCDGKVVLANQSAGAMFGAESSDDMIGMDSLSLVNPDYQNFVLGQRTAALKEQVSLPPAETRHQRLDGTQFESEYTTGPVVWHGRPATVSLIRDITARKKAEEELRQAQKMETVGQLTGGVAHDFNNLLAIILGNAEILADVVDKERKVQADAIVRAAQRGSDLTHRLLAFSRRQTLEPKVINVNDILRNLIGLLQRTLEENIEIETKYAPGLWNCKIDSAQFENALLNLAVNARDAMPDGGKLIIETYNKMLDDAYSAAHVDVAAGQYVAVAVTDSGAGIPPEIRDQVFEPFFTTKESGKGTGLGLSMIMGFVKQSGGHVAIESEVGKGTTIKLYLPRYRGKTAVVERRRPSIAAEPGNGEVVLVVEDDTDLRTMVVKMLRSLGYGVLESDNAKRAFAALKENPGIRLLLTDVMLPGGVSGRALAERVRKWYPDFPVLFMSGYTNENIVREEGLGVKIQLLEKPFRKADLAQAVRAAFGGEPV